MSIHKFKTAIICEVEVEFEYEPAEPEGRDSPPAPAGLQLINVMAISPLPGSDDWEDIREEAWGEIERLRMDAEAAYADRGDYEYERIRDERMMGGE